MLISRTHRPTAAVLGRHCRAITRLLVADSDHGRLEENDLAPLQRANSNNPAVRLLMSEYEQVRDNCVRSTCLQIDNFLVKPSVTLTDQTEAGRLADFCGQLVTDYYNSLQSVPWLQFHSPPISFIQFILNDAMSFYLEPVATSTQMKQLGEAACVLAPHLDVLELAVMLHNLLLLGLPKSHQLIRHFYDRVGVHIKSISKSAQVDSRLLRLLGEIGKVNRLMGTRSSEEIRPVIQLLSNTVAEQAKRPEELTLVDITSLLSILSSRLALNIHDELALGRLGLIFFKQRCGKEQLSPRFFSLLFAWLSQYRGASLGNVLNSVSMTRRQLLDHVYHSVSPMAKSLSDVEIAEIASELKRARCYPGRLRSELSARALLLCSGSFDLPLDIRILSNSFYALDHTCDPHLIQFFTEKFSDHLDNADVLLISNIAENLQNFHRAVSSEFKELFLEHVERLSLGIITHMTRLGRVLSFLERLAPHEIPPAFNYRFCTSLITQLEKHESRRLPCQMIFPYLIANFSHQMPDAMYHRLLAILPQFKLAALEKLLQSIRNAPMHHYYPHRIEKRSAVSRHLRSVQSGIYQRVLDMVESRKLAPKDSWQLSVGQLFRMARILIRGQQISHGQAAVTFSTVMEQLAKSVQVSAPSHAYQLSHLVLGGAYYSERLLERLENFILVRSTVEMPLLHHILRAMAAVGYEPDDPVLLGNACGDMVLSNASLRHPAKRANSFQSRTTILSVLRISHALALIQCYPTRLLEFVFSPVFLEQVDHLLHDTWPKKPASHHQDHHSASLHDHIRETLMRLNRAAALEGTADLQNIPWFHNNYMPMKQASSRRPVYRKWALKEEVREAVEQLAEGRDDFFLLVDQLTPFYHFIDFELIPMDDKPQPPIAVLLLSHRQFVASGQPTVRLRGSVKQVMRQLEILGYRVVTLSPRRWRAIIDEANARNNSARNEFDRDHGFMTKRYVMEQLGEIIFAPQQ